MHIIYTIYVNIVHIHNTNTIQNASGMKKTFQINSLLEEWSIL